MSALVRRLHAPGAAPAGNDDWVERVRAASDIADVVQQTVPLRRVGRNLMGRCPFHEEKSASFSVNPERQFYHCFGCKAGGDVFKYVMETEKVGFVEAVTLLSRRAGIPVPERRGGSGAKRAPLFEALDAAATAYEQWLADPQQGAAARAYLERRGITRDTQREFRLGLSLPGWENLVPRLRGRFSEEVLVEARLAGRKEGSRSTFDWFRNRLMVPLIAPGGMVIGFGARAMGDEQPKYLNSPESAVYHKSQFLFALDQARRAVKADGEMIVVEGYFDAIALHQAGLRHTVATSGTALTADHARALRRMVRGVALTYDGDAAGQNAMLRSLGVLLAEGLDVVVVDLPKGDDPDTLVQREGLAGWERVRASAYDAMDFVHRHVLRTTTGGDPRERALQVAVRLIAGVPEAVRRQLLTERAAQVFAVPEAVVARAARLANTGDTGGATVTAAVQQQRVLGSGIERQLLEGLWHAPELLDQVRGQLPVEAFEDEAARDLAAYWWENGVEVPEEDGPTAGIARELAASDGGAGLDHASSVRGAVRTMRVRMLQAERRALQARMKGASPEQEAAALIRLNQIGLELRELGTGGERN
jgi:DNA primase